MAEGSSSFCTHCALPLRGRASEEGERFCCSGCFLAHRLGRRSLEGNTDRLLSRLVLAAFLAMGVMVFSLSLYGGMLHESDGSAAAQALTGLLRLSALAFSTPAMLLLGLPLFDAVVALRRWLSADALILLGTAAAWSVSSWNTFRGGGEVYFDTATMVLVLYSAGRWLDARSRERAAQELRRILPEREAPAIQVDLASQREIEVRPEELCPGDVIRLRPGEIVPVDGVVIEGRSFLDASALTGESQPASVAAPDRIFAGATLVDGTLLVRATAGVGGRLRDEIDRLLREALERPSRWVRLADRLAGSLMPIIVVVASATWVVHWRELGAERAWLNALSVVLISCPCALGIATPLAFWTAIGAAWKRGVLVRGGETLERLARVRVVFLDKTGTLTTGGFRVASIQPNGAIGEEEALALAAALELGSEHPIARALRSAWRERGRDALPRVEDFQVLAGEGVCGRIGGIHHALVRAKAPTLDSALTEIELVREGETLARFALDSCLRPDARKVVEALRERGLAPRVLTGDAEGPSRALARELAIEVEARLSPADKVARMRGARAAFVGDGLNDAAALAAAEVGISVAGGSAASLSAARINLLRPGLGELPSIIDLARRAVLAAKLNLAWAFLYNAIGLYLAVNGALTPIFAASAMVVSSIFSALNSRRLILPGEPAREPLRTTPQPSCALGTTTPLRS